MTTDQLADIFVTVTMWAVGALVVWIVGGWLISNGIAHFLLCKLLDPMGSGGGCEVPRLW